MVRSVASMVDEQVYRWGQGAKSSRRPCVAISHLTGSDGLELGRRVADRLSYGFFDRAIVDGIVHDQAVQQRLVRAVDEHVRSLIDRYLLDAFRTQRFGESDYLRSLVRVVRTLGQLGDAVLLGRGSAFILSKREALRVLVVAPTPLRVERFAKAHGLDHAAAAVRLEREDADRSEFIHHHFGVRQDDPSSYELAVNTGSLPLDVAANLVVEALRGAFPAGLPADALGGAVRKGS